MLLKNSKHILEMLTMINLLNIMQEEYSKIRRISANWLILCDK